MYKFGQIPYLLQILAILIVGFTILSIGFRNLFLIRKSNYVTNYWILFALFISFAALFSKETAYAFQGISVYVSFLIVLLCAGVIYQTTGDIDWFKDTIVLIAILSAICATFFGQPYVNGDYIVKTMGELNNPNTLGMTISFGMYYLLLYSKEGNVSALKWLIKMLITALFLYVVINTGSRSSLICCCITVFLAGISIFRNLNGTRVERVIKKSAIIVIAIISVLFMIKYFSNTITSNAGIQRFQDRFNLASIYGRTHLYQRGWEVFKTAPLLGVGYKCFEILSGYGYFSHSTYTELLSCCGIIGTILFLWPVAKGFIKAIRIRNKDRGRHLTLLILFLITGFFGIWFYDLVYFMILYVCLYEMQNDEMYGGYYL